MAITNGVKRVISFGDRKVLAVSKDPLPISEENKFLEISKYSREGYIIIFPNKVFILNYMDYTMNNCISYVIDLETPFFTDINCIGNEPIIFSTNDISDLKSEKSPIYYTYGPGWVNLISGDVSVISTLDSNIRSFIISNNISTMHADQMYGYDTSIPCFIENDLKSNMQFADIMAKKAADGQGLLTIADKYDMFLYPSLLPVNKPDKVSLEIYEVDNISFISKFTIKKKIFDIKIYIRFGYVRR